MHSFRDRSNPRRNAYLRLVGEIESGLRDAYAMKHESAGLTQSDIAAKLGVGRSVINRRLRGRQNMTIESVADLVWAMDHCIDVSVYDPSERQSNSAGEVIGPSPARTDVPPSGVRPPSPSSDGIVLNARVTS